MTRMIAWALSVLVLVAASPRGALAQGGGPPPAMVRVDQAKLETVEMRRMVTGDILATRRSMLAAERQGIVVHFDVREGDVVETGQVIAQLDDKRAEMGLRQAEAQQKADAALVRSLEAELERATRELERLQSAAESESAARLELDDAETERNRSQALLEQAIARKTAADVAREIAQENLDDLAIRAPFSGALIQRLTELGQWVGEGDTVAEIVDMDSMEAWVDVPERFVNRLREASADAHVMVGGSDEPVVTPITRIIPSGNPTSHMFRVRIALDNSDRNISPGMSVTAMIPTGKSEQTLTVHKDAIVRQPSGEIVYFEAGGVAALARVRSLFGVGDRVAISSNQLPPDASVVIEGNERLFPGQPLNITGEGPAPRRANRDGQSEGEADGSAGSGN